MDTAGVRKIMRRMIESHRVDTKIYCRQYTFISQIYLIILHKITVIWSLIP